MIGEYRIRVKNSRNNYSFILRRNITVLQGDSGRGKTTLYDIIREYNNYGKESGAGISCDRELVAVEGKNWESEIVNHPGTIIVIDEDSRFIRSKDFAEIVKNSDNYFLLITRNYLEQLPVSVDEIYQLQGTKNKTFKRVYNDQERIFDNLPIGYLPFKPEVIITEDSGSAFQMFKAIAEKRGIICASAGGKSNVLRTLNLFSEKRTVVVADGAAFGSEMADVVHFQSVSTSRMAIYLPESFEWLIMVSGVVIPADKTKLDFPYLFADSTKFMSWEQFFTELLVDYTKNSDYQKYNKRRLSEYYLQDKILQIVADYIHGLEFDE